MQDFLCNYRKSKCGNKNQADSLVYEIEKNDIYEEFYMNKILVNIQKIRHLMVRQKIEDETKSTPFVKFRRKSRTYEFIKDYGEYKKNKGNQ